MIFRRASAFQRPRYSIIGQAIFVGIILALYFFGAEVYRYPDTGKKVRVAISSDQEAALGLQSYREILSQSKVVTSGKDKEISEKVAKKLINVVDPISKEKFNWDINVIQNDEANAFCLPGGKIAVYTGIFKYASNEAELAAVIGHEIAHATLRHGAQRIFQQNLSETALAGVNQATVDLDPSQRQLLSTVLGAGFTFGLVLPFSRDHETEADEMGLKYLIRAGYQPEAALKFWEAMDNANKQQPPQWLSTHPSNKNRIQYLKSLIAEYRNNGTIAQYPVFPNK